MVLGASDGMVYYGDDHMYALAADTGEEFWRFDDGGVHASATTVDGTTYLDYRFALHAVDSHTGAPIWSNTTVSSGRQEPAVADGTIYLTGDDALYAVDMESGDDLWEFEPGNPIVSSPVVAEGTVYFSSSDGTFYAVNADTGGETWRHGFDGELWDPVIAGGADEAIVAEGVIYFENDGYACAFAAGTGDLLWQHALGPNEVEILSVTDGVIYLRDIDGAMYTLDADDGSLLWEERLGENLTVVGDTIYFEDGGRLHAVSAQAE